MPFTTRTEHRWILFENKEIMIIFGSKREEVTGNREKYLTRSVMILGPSVPCFIKVLKS